MKFRNLLQLVVIVGLITLLADSAFAQVAGGNGEPNPPSQTKLIDLSAIEEASCWVLYFVEGSFGALLVAVAALGSLLSAAMGMYRTAIQAIVVALGAFLIEPVGIMFFDYSPQNCGQYVLPSGKGNIALGG